MTIQNYLVRYILTHNDNQTRHYCPHLNLLADFLHKKGSYRNVRTFVLVDETNFAI